MCLAAALLRTPDEETRDRLDAVKDRLSRLGSHAGPRTPAGQRLHMEPDAHRQADRPDEEARCDLSGHRAAGRPTGRSVIRRVGAAVRIMGEQFVWAPRQGHQARPSSAPSTCWAKAPAPKDADRYEAHADAIVTALYASDPGPEAGHGVSVKLSSSRRAMSPPARAGGVVTLPAHQAPRPFKPPPPTST
jgi:RHH-type proline utilization regulon transcriptional repressor/proline dehydrogenase/delta 1-pyrroline-5-carboxylate dehydrogenase